MKAVILIAALVILQRAPEPPSCRSEFAQLKTDVELEKATTGEYQLKSRLPNSQIGFTNITFPDKQFDTPCAFLRAYKKNGLTPLEFYRVNTAPLSLPGRP